MPHSRIPLEDALALARTGDIWLFRGRTGADRLVQVTTNAPVNHVGMSLVIEDLPPLLWHAELGRSLPDVWSGTSHRGAQLHDLEQAVGVWGARYGQQAWVRQLEPPATRSMEDAALQTVARLDGTPFPSSARLATRWLGGRLSPRQRERRREGGLETAYCAELVAITYAGMGLLDDGHRPSWYDPGRFWSGDALELTGGQRLGGEIAVDHPNTHRTAGHRTIARRRAEQRR